jgi:hypothetical protein
MSPLPPPRNLEPFSPRITLNLRDDYIPEGYTTNYNNGEEDEDEDIYADEDIEYVAIVYLIRCSLLTLLCLGSNEGLHLIQLLS